MSDRGIPDGYRFMNGYGSHTFSFLNDKGELTYVKFHYKSMQGIKTLTNEEATRLKGEDPDYSQRDLMSAISKGDFPKYALKIQVMTELQARNFQWNPFDLTIADTSLVTVASAIRNVLFFNRNHSTFDFQIGKHFRF